MTIDELKQDNANINRVYHWEKRHQNENEPMTDSRRVDETADDLATECRQNVYDGLVNTDKK